MLLLNSFFSSLVYRLVSDVAFGRFVVDNDVVE